MANPTEFSRMGNFLLFPFLEGRKSFSPFLDFLFLLVCALGVFLASKFAQGAIPGGVPLVLRARKMLEKALEHLSTRVRFPAKSEGAQHKRDTTRYRKLRKSRKAENRLRQRIRLDTAVGESVRRRLPGFAAAPQMASGLRPPAAGQPGRDAEAGGVQGWRVDANAGTGSRS